MNLNSEFKKALDHHLCGDLQSAAELYESILKIEPNQARILHLAGVLANQRRDSAKARRLISRAIAIEP